MALAGFELVNVDDSRTVIDYSFPAAAIEAGVEQECYREFEAIDIAWQVQNAYSDAGSTQVRACLEAAGLVPAGTVESEYAQLVESGLVDSCFAEAPQGDQ